MKAPTRAKPKSKTNKPSEEVGDNRRLFVRMDDSQNQEQLVSLKRLIDAYTGPTEVVLVLGRDEQRQAIKLPMKVDPSEDALQSLRGLLGEANVKLQ